MKFAITYSKEKKCEYLFNFFKKNYNLVAIEEADIIICLGGDGFMLHTLHNYAYLNIPIYGLNCGHLGFLMNEIEEINGLERIKEQISNAKAVTFHPLEVKFTNTDGKETSSLAFNEISLLRQDGVAAHIQISINDELKLNHLTADGLMVATPVGSNAYNRACGGPQIPLESNLLVLTAINAFSPLNFKSAVITDNSIINLTVLSPTSRIVSLFCDFIRYENIAQAEIIKSPTKTITLLFNHDNHLSKKTLNAQFSI